MTFDEVVELAAQATRESPLSIVVSPCLLGDPVGYDGSSWPSHPVRRLCGLPNVAPHPFCPENHGLGTPREWMSIHGGDGHDVLDGEATVVMLGGRDVTREFVSSAEAMVELAGQKRAVLGC